MKLSVKLRTRLVLGAGVAGAVNIAIGLWLNPKVAADDGGLLPLAFLALLFCLIGFAVGRRFMCVLLTSTRYERVVIALTLLIPLPWSLDTFAPFNYWLAGGTGIAVVAIGLMRGESARSDACCERALNQTDTPANRP
ncbi:MAG: hypothetical protein ACM3Q1_02735 [Bacteroidales bacterium]